MSYYNYTTDEEEFSRKIIRYWSNFIKTGSVNFFFFAFFSFGFFRNPNRGSKVDVEWKEYLKDEHNYMFFQLNEIRNELNYFDSMYEFWSEFFRIETSGGCETTLMKMKTKTIFFAFSLLLICLFTLGTIGCFCKYVRKKDDNSLSSSPHLVST